MVCFSKGASAFVHLCAIHEKMEVWQIRCQVSPSTLRLPLLHLRVAPHPTHLLTSAIASDSDDASQADSSWEEELMDEFHPLHYLHAGKGKRRRSRNRKARVSVVNAVDGLGNDFDWAERARQRAFLAVEARDPKAVNLLRKKIQPKSNKKKVPGKKIAAEGLKAVDESLSQEEGVAHKVEAADDALELGKTGNSGNWPLAEEGRKMKFASKLANGEEVIERERAFNRRVVEASDAQEVLEIVGNSLERTRLLGYTSLLTPFNAVTALHRIAKHMEAGCVSTSERLTFARKKYMSELVARAIEVLSGCSAQGLSNMAWALAKVGGSSLYFSEMDRIAEVALGKVCDFNAQNIANMAGAYASMQHSAPSLFESLACQASLKVEKFKPQELAQVLWAFAALFRPADPLFDALDCLRPSSVERSQKVDVGNAKEPSDRFLKRSVDGNHVEHGQSVLSAEFSGEFPMNDPGSLSELTVESLQASDRGACGNTIVFDNATVEQLANIAWSYAVLRQVERPSFKYLWQILDSVGSRYVIANSHKRGDRAVWFMSQVHQVNLCLQYEYQLDLTLRTSLKVLAAEAWEKHKSDIVLTSVHQKDVEWLLVSTGMNWVTECTVADYSLDLAIVDKKIALEFDGPSHFARNTGSPLGHTVLKRRILEGAGWIVLSIPFQEWEELDGEEERMQYLKRLLKSVAKDR